MPAYDTTENFKIPDWIADSVFTRNTVTLEPSCVDYVHSIKHKLGHYKNEPEEFLKGIFLIFQSFIAYSLCILHDRID